MDSCSRFLCIYSLLYLCFFIERAETKLHLKHGNICPNASKITVKYFHSHYFLVNESLISIQKAGQQCCLKLSFTSHELEYENSNSIEDLLHMDDEKENLTFYIPSYVPRESQFVFDDFPFIAIWRSPGPAVIAEKRDSSRANQIGKVILDCWLPIMFLLILGALAGILYWFLERRSNTKQFPANFFKGAWEGYWCAMVTMMTVGYGDRTPRTILGRLFSIIWMLLSAVLISTFTAYLSSALTVQDIDLSEDHYMGKFIGVPLGSKSYYNTQYNLGAKYEECRTVETFMAKMKSGDIKKGIIDDYLIAKYLIRTNQQLKSDYFIERVFPKPLDIGIAVTGNRLEFEDEEYSSRTENKRFYKCLRKGIQHIIASKNLFQDYKEKITQQTSSPFDIMSFTGLVVIMAVLFVSLFFIGASWQIFINLQENQTVGDTETSSGIEVYADGNNCKGRDSKVKV